MRELSSRRRFLKRAAFAGGGALLGTVSLNQISPMIWREPLVFELNRSYWARSQPPQSPPLTDDISADVAVLGLACWSQCIMKERPLERVEWMHGLRCATLCRASLCSNSGAKTKS